MFFQYKQIEVWTKPLDPIAPKTNVWALAVLSKRIDGAPYYVSIPLKRLGLDPSWKYTFTEVFGALKPFEISINEPLTVKIPPTSKSNNFPKKKFSFITL